jgi:thiamine pyrophosphate-dependent acetolactate synthase large subunit-like protein
MSMAKGLLPDTHPQCAGAARSTVLKDADVVMLVGARLNWSHGKGKSWGEAPKKFIQIDIMMEAFGGVGVNATTPDELKRAVNEAMDSGKPTLINAVIDPVAGSESGRIGNLNPQSVLRKK